MADRATWKGTLKIALVQIPIKVFPATESSDSVSFNQLHDQDLLGHPCHARIKQKTVCPSCDREVPHAEIVKGFEFEKDRYVLVNADELAAIAPLSTRVIDLVQFADASALELRAIDRAYYLAPDGPEGGPAREAYLLIAEALIGRVGIGKLAIYGREYLVAVSPRERTLLLYTLHHAAELREAPPVADGGAVVAQLRLAQRVVAALTRPLDLAAFTDEYRDGVRQLIAAKIAGEEYVRPPIADTPPVGSLHDALTQSLAVISATKATKAAKVTLREKRKRA